MKKGYTLIEVLAAVAIFSIVLSSITGFFIGVLKSQRSNMANQELIDNISFTLEYVSRSLRMARKDDVVAKGETGEVNCLSGNKVNYELTHSGQGIKFRSYKNECINFFVEDGRLKEWKKVGVVETENFLTPESMGIELFAFGPEDSWDQLDNEQPKVTFFIKAKMAGGEGLEYQPEISIQTSVSQRNIDVEY
jgi:prepilin-type N-terminal cleavage/methylation domain-containing protein